MVRLLLLEIVPPFLGAGLERLIPDGGGLAEAVLLVRVVVVGRELLDLVALQHALEVPVVVGDSPQAEATGLQGVHPRHAGLAQVRNAAQVLDLGLVQHRRHHLGRVEIEELDAVDIVLGRPADPGAALFRRVAGTAFPARTGGRVVEDARRHDLVAGAAGLLAGDHGVVVEHKGHGTDRGHAVGHPELVDIGQVRRLVGRAAVGVHVDEARQDVLARGVDHLVGRRQLGPRRADVARPRRFMNLGDDIVVDDDVHGADGRRAGAVDQGRAMDDQGVERPHPFARLAGRRGVHPGGLRRRRQRHRRRHRRSHRRALQNGLHAHVPRPCRMRLSSRCSRENAIRQRSQSSPWRVGGGWR